MNIYLILCYNKTNNLRILKSIQQLWNIPRFLELKTCFNSKNVTVSDPAANMTKEIQVSPTHLNIAVKVPYADPIWHSLLVPLLFRNQNMPFTQKIPSNLSPSHTREQFKDQNQVPVLCPTALRVAESYTRDYILIANFVAMLLLPFLIITILNFRLFKTIKV